MYKPVPLVSGPFNVTKQPIVKPLSGLSAPARSGTRSGSRSGSSTPRSASADPILICVCPFDGESKNELTVRQGDSLYILSEKTVNGWILVQNTETSKAGWVPQDRVCVFDPSGQSQLYQPSQLSSPPQTPPKRPEWSAPSTPSASKLHQRQAQHTTANAQPHQNIPAHSDSKPCGDAQRSLTRLKTVLDSHEKRFMTELIKPLRRPSAFGSNQKGSVSAPASVATSPIPRAQTSEHSTAAFGQHHEKHLKQPQKEMPRQEVRRREVRRQELQHTTTFPYQRISVCSVGRHNGRYWYRVDLANLEADTKIHLCRFYQDFYDLQVALLENKSQVVSSNIPCLPNVLSPAESLSQADMAFRCNALTLYLRKLVCQFEVTGDPFLSRILLAWCDIRVGDFEHSSTLTNQQISQLIHPQDPRPRSNLHAEQQKAQSPAQARLRTQAREAIGFSIDEDDLPTSPLFSSQSHSSSPMSYKSFSEVSEFSIW